MKAATLDLRASFEHELRSQTTTMVFSLVRVMLTMAALAFAMPGSPSCATVLWAMDPALPSVDEA